MTSSMLSRGRSGRERFLVWSPGGVAYVLGAVSDEAAF